MAMLHCSDSEKSGAPTFSAAPALFARAVSIHRKIFDYAWFGPFLTGFAFDRCCKNPFNLALRGGDSDVPLKA
ncbi:hypothetical protein GRI43_05950 [Altererythrobacter luteolus]|uniref:Uncharacterized protein n=1 Tax=Pontixanthobacter luteolus TaxID=295089 RepID=A0A6I4V0Z0_9SPHN|nr:hypothetical protein [Pontixanthobacter luteolus]MXP46931.1 hypothetical protein [Pontixanthobacter luteolus]